MNTKYDLRSTIPDDSHNVYGVLLKGIGVCDGYATTTQLLLTIAGLDCITIRGVAASSLGSEGHAWNIIKIDGIHYHLDTTWDDPVPDTKGFVRYDYFNLTDDEISEDHR